jgi:hypothetical protein
VTSRRPTLRWALPSSVAAATVDLCADRACATPIGTPLLVTGTRYAPSTDLPVGVVYWRLHPSTRTTLTSATWQFTVGARSAPVDTSWGTTLDVNGDGYADVAVSVNRGGNEQVYVHLGSRAGLATAPATELSGYPDANSSFGESIASAGDVNGDGYADLVVGAPLAATANFGGSGDAFVYLGGPAGLASKPATKLDRHVSGDNVGISVASAGDVNGDGYADVVIGGGQVRVYLGSATGLATDPVAVMKPPSNNAAGEDFGSRVASAGDVNGDGYGDIVVTSYGERTVYLFLGGPDGPSKKPSATITGPGAKGNFGYSVASAGDVNGDGYADLVVGEAGSVFVYLGSATGLATAPSATLTGSAAGSFGDAVAGAGDVNGDGYADIVVGASGSASAYLYLGGSAGLAATSAAVLTGPDAQGRFGGSVASAGDVNGDGLADVLVGADDASHGAGRAYYYPGGTSGLATSPAATLGPDGASGFGFRVCGASD